MPPFLIRFADPSVLLLAQDDLPSWVSLMPFVAIGLLFYFLLIRPEQRKRAEMTKLMESLKKNDRVVTIGGIFGVVVNVEKGSEEVTLRVDESSNTRLRVLRSAIARVVTKEESQEAKDS